MRFLKEYKEKNSYVYFVGNNGSDVTGSCTIVCWGSTKIAVDFGLVQTNTLIKDYLSNRNQIKKISSNSVDAIVLTHIHVDHCGGLLLDQRNGNRCPIYIPEGTKELLQIMLEDTAKILKQDAQKISHDRKRTCIPLSSVEYVPMIMERCIEVPFGKEIKIHEAPKARSFIFLEYFHAGHIVGSAQCVLKLKRGSVIKKVGFTGDIGGEEKSVSVHPRETLPRCNVIVGEATYSNPKRNFSKEKDRYFDNYIIKDCINSYNKILVPVFALQRTEDFLMNLAEIRTDVRVYLDSSLACRIIKAWPDKLEFLDKLNFHMIESWEDSVKLQNSNEHCIILASGGMMTSGRVLPHLKTIIEDENNSILFCGYSIENSLATKIKMGEQEIEIDGEKYKTKASVYVLVSFSTHCNYNQLTDYYVYQTDCDKLCLVHSNMEDKIEYAHYLEDMLSFVNRSTKVIPVETGMKVSF